MPCRRSVISRPYLRGMDDNSLFRLLDSTKVAQRAGTQLDREVATADHQRITPELSRRTAPPPHSVKR